MQTRDESEDDADHGEDRMETSNRLSLPADRLEILETTGTIWAIIWKPGLSNQNAFAGHLY